MKISLILCTINRISELERFLSALALQTYQHFELIIVDQNQDNRLDVLCQRYASQLSLRHEKVNFSGLSKARNFGLTFISGDIIAFPDDDCWYGNKDILQTAAEEFAKNCLLDFASFPVVDEHGQNIAKFPPKPTSIFPTNVFLTTTSISLFFRKSVFAKIGNFEEAIGIGSNSSMQSGEEVDFVLRALKNNLKGYYFTNGLLNHPKIVARYNDSIYQAKVFGYSKGYGYLLKKYDFPFWFIIKNLLRPLLGALLFLVQFKLPHFCYHIKIFWGRIIGYFNG